MNLKTYQKECARTCSDLGSLGANLAHMVLGIFSEEEEYIKALVEKDMVNAFEELGDKFWYIGNYCNFRKLNLEKLYNDRENYKVEEWQTTITSGIVALSKLQDYTKKHLAYGKDLDKGKEENEIRGLLFYIAKDIEIMGGNLEDILEKNINKLRVRFPDKFSKTKALKRDLKAERIELEK